MNTKTSSSQAERCSCQSFMSPHKKESNIKKEDKEGSRQTGIEETIMKMVKTRLDFQVSLAREKILQNLLEQKTGL